MGENVGNDHAAGADAESKIGTRTVLGIPANKRGALGVAFWLVGALACFTPAGFVVGVPLLLVAAYLLIYSR